MPDVSTARTRDITISGGGTFGRDNAGIAPFTLHRPRATWSSISAVNGYYAFVSGGSLPSDGAGTDPSGAFPPPVLHGPDPGAPPPHTLAFWVTIVHGAAIKTQKFYTAAFTPLHQIWWVGGTGAFDFSDSVHCVQHFNPGPYEVSTVTDFSMTASATVICRDLTTGTETSTSAGVTMSLAEALAGGVSSGSLHVVGSTPAGYTFSFSGCPLNFENNCTIGFDQPGLISAVSGISTSFGKPHLHGSGSSLSFGWGGSAGDINPFWQGTGSAAADPGASVFFLPSWAMAVTSEVYHYQDASEVGATIQHFNGTDLLGEFTSGSSYRYPASGLVDDARLTAFGPGASRVTPTTSSSGMQPGSVVPTDLNYDPSLVLSGWDYGPIGFLLQKPVALAHPYDPTPSSRSTFFRVKPEWANAYATYIKSAHPAPNSSSLAPKQWAPYPQGTITWDDTHRFLLFEDTGPCTKLVEASTPGATTDLHVKSVAGFIVGDAVGVGFEGVIISSISPGHLTVGPTGVSHPAGTSVIRTYLGATSEGSRWAPSQFLVPPPTFAGAAVAVDLAPSVHKVSGAGLDGFAVEVNCTGQALVDASLRYLLLHQGYRYAQIRLKSLAPTTTLTADTAASDTDLPVADESGFNVGDQVTVDTDTVTITAVSSGHLTVSALPNAHTSGATVTAHSSLRALFSLSSSVLGSIGWLLRLPSTTLAEDVAAGDTDLPVTSSSGFGVGDEVDVGGPTETVTVSAVSAGHLTVSALVSDHTAGSPVVLHPGSWHSYDLDLASPQYKIPPGRSEWQATSELVHPDTFVTTFPFSAFGATVALQLLDAGTYTFDWLEGQLNTTGDRTPRLLFPFLDGFGDAYGTQISGAPNPLDIYEPSPGRPFPTGLPEQWLTWVVNGVRGATVRPQAAPGDFIESVNDLWQYLKTYFDSATNNPQSVLLGFPKPNDTGITVLPGVLGDPDPLAVFGPSNQGEFQFDGGGGGYGLKGSPQSLSGRLRPFVVSAYYGCGDLTATSGGYDAVVQFDLDWLFDGEAIVNVRGAGSDAVLLADNDTGATIDSSVPDDDGMARLHGKYGVVHPNNNVTGAVEWSPIVPPHTTLTSTVLAGSTDLPVASSAGFAPGDTVTTGGFADPSESVTVSAVSAGHLTVSPVANTHSAGATITRGASSVPGIGYTIQGLLENADWLGGAISPKDGGYWETGNPLVRADVVILDRYQTFLLAGGARGALQPFNLEDDVGGYHRADVGGGRIRYKHADLTSPPFVTTAFATTGPSDSEPRMAVWLNHRIVLLFTRGATDVYETVSHSEGITWSTPTMAFPGGKHPLPAVGRGRELLRAAYVGGNLRGTLQDPGDPTASAPFTFVDASGAPLAVEDDSFGFAAAHEGAARWWLVVVIAGETEVSDWFSNDGQTWLRVS